MGKYVKIMVVLLLLGILLFIWGNSVIPGGESNLISDKVTQVVGGAVTHTAEDALNANTWLTSSLLRKIAHIAEFASLGMAAFGLTVLMKKSTRRHLPLLLFAGMTIALVDETIQLFTNRQSLVKDVWIDFGGYLIGLAIAAVICAVWRGCSYYRRKWKERGQEQ